MASREQIVEVSEATEEDKHLNGRYERFNELLGRGAYKEVYKAWDTRDQVDVAWNQIDLTRVPNEEEKQNILRECKMLEKLNHPNVLRIHNRWYDAKDDKLCFVTTLMQNGSLRKFFRQRKVNVRKLKKIAKQILTALDYLHQQSIIHRDLKCDNVFIDGVTGKIVIGDLGLSSEFNSKAFLNSTMSIVGTPHWMAPELYKEKYDEQADIWSFGMCILELVTDTIPYQECRSAPAVYQKVLLDQKKPDILQQIGHQSVRDFIEICLEFDFRKRPTAAELLDHPFLLPNSHDSVKCESRM